jgi:hypothetical protein
MGLMELNLITSLVASAYDLTVSPYFKSAKAKNLKQQKFNYVIYSIILEIFSSLAYHLWTFQCFSFITFITYITMHVYVNKIHIFCVCILEHYTNKVSTTCGVENT